MFYICIYDGATIPYCTKYVFFNGDFYCRSDGCSDGSSTIIVDTTNNLHYCTKLPLYPYDYFGACN